MKEHVGGSFDRIAAIGIAAASSAIMLYVGLYQSRAVRHLWCPVFKHACEAVANAAFAVEKLSIWIPLLALVALATLANFLGVRDMANLGSFCFYCVLTTVLSPVLLWMVWKLR